MAHGVYVHPPEGPADPIFFAKRIIWTHEVHQCDASDPHTGGDDSKMSKHNWMTYNVEGKDLRSDNVT